MLFLWRGCLIWATFFWPQCWDCSPELGGPQPWGSRQEVQGAAMLPSSCQRHCCPFPHSLGQPESRWTPCSSQRQGSPGQGESLLGFGVVVTGKAGGPLMGEWGNLVQVWKLTHVGLCFLPWFSGAQGPSSSGESAAWLCFPGSSKGQALMKYLPFEALPRPEGFGTCTESATVCWSQDRWSRLHSWLVRCCVDLHLERVRIIAFTRPRDTVRSSSFSSGPWRQKTLFLLNYPQTEEIAHTESLPVIMPPN